MKVVQIVRVMVFGLHWIYNFWIFFIVFVNFGLSLCFSLLAFVCPEFTWLTRLAQPAAAVCALCHNGSIVKLYKVTPPPPPDKQI